MCVQVGDHSSHGGVGEVGSSRHRSRNASPAAPRRDQPSPDADWELVEKQSTSADKAAGLGKHADWVVDMAAGPVELQDLGGDTGTEKEADSGEMVEEPADSAGMVSAVTESPSDVVGPPSHSAQTVEASASP
jgi:hypothetical protein